LLLWNHQAPQSIAGFSFFVGIVAGVAVSYLGMKCASRVSGLIADEGLRVITRLMTMKCVVYRSAVCDK
jgi:small neutral amino acid transporter SnatA (MarC family)